MDAIWWLPTAVLVLGSLLMLGRLRTLERQVAASALAVVRVQATGEAVHAVAHAARLTGAERSRVADVLAPGSER